MEKLGTFKPEAAVKSIDVTPDSEVLVVGQLIGLIQLFNVRNGQCIGKI